MNMQNNGYNFAKAIATAVFYIVAAILMALGCWSLSSCGVSRETNSVGKTTIITNDTTHINHTGSYTLKFNKQ